MSAANFELAAESIKEKKPNVSNDKLLQLYGLYKQATVGDCNTSKPGIFDQKGRAKWDAWNKITGTSTDKAKEQYVALVEEILGEKF